MSDLNILNVPPNYQGLPHQKQALLDLWESLTPDQRDHFTDTWRTPIEQPPLAGRRQINRAGLELIKEFEGCRLAAYLCPAGVWTIGYGHTGLDVYPGLTITQAIAEQLLRQDLERFEKAVNDLVKVPLTDNQFAALVSFAFNVGEGALTSSTLLKLLNSGDYQAAADQFRRWTRAGDEELPGLVRRRKAERKLFLS